MKIYAFVLSVYCFLLPCTGVHAAAPLSENERPGVLFQNETSPVIVLWIVQSEICLVQFHYPDVRDGQKQPEHPPVQAWLLKADGTLIPQSEKPSTVGLSNAGSTSVVTSYVFPLAAKAEACAVAVRIGDKFFVAKLPTK